MSLVGLIIGSMIPDFEYFIRTKVSSEYSHTWPGLFWFDLPLGLLTVFIYQLLVRDKLIDNLPTALNRRFSRYRSISTKRYSLKYLVVVALCVLLGAASHILWDGFTHPTGRFVLLMPALSDTVQLFNQPIFIYKILQHGSSIIGATAIIITIYRLPLNHLTKKASIAGYWITVMVIMCILVGTKFLSGLSLQQYGELIVTIISGSMLGLIVASVMTIKRSMFR